MSRRPYLERLDVKNVRCIKDVSVALTPLHAFIGPNDSGKSTLLRCIAALGARVAAAFASEQIGSGEITAHSMLRGFVDSYEIRAREHGRLDLGAAPPEMIVHALGNPQVMRLDPDALSAPSQLIPSDNAVAFTTPRGDGLASVCDAILTRDIDAWSSLSRQFVAMFPTTARLELTNSSKLHKQLGAVLGDGKTRITAQQMSEGMLYWLAFAVLNYADRPGIFLVEEPENGLHPSRIKQVVELLRTVSERAQVVLATHSPLVINELKPEEVSIVTRTVERGTIVTPMTQTKHFEQRSKVYALGELWLSYADGEVEAELQPDPVSGASSG